MFDFDTPVDRRNTNSLKWDKYAGRDIIPMWVADMDFRAPQVVSDALFAIVEHGIFGYSMVNSSLTETIIDRMARLYQWQIEAEWIVWVPGVVSALNLSCRAVGERGDAVMTSTPVYPPFLFAPRLSERQLQAIPLTRADGTWGMDIDRMNAECHSRTRLFLLCNPHNPVGRAFRPAELAQLADFCCRHDITICSDEIHGDLLLDPLHHTPIATLSSDIAARTITLFAPSKTYNIPGLGCSFAIIPNRELRRRFQRAQRGIVPDMTLPGLVACEAAYKAGGPWLNALLEYLRKNRQLVIDKLQAINGLTISRIEATYLAWIDTRETGIPDVITRCEQAGVAVSDGRDFSGPGYIRLNFGCPRVTLEEGLRRIHAALDI